MPELTSADQLFLSGGRNHDYIVDIECGKRNSAFITHQGQVWITGNYILEKPQGAGAAGSGQARKESFDGSELSKEDKKAILSLPGGA